MTLRVAPTTNMNHVATAATTAGRAAASRPTSDRRLRTAINSGPPNTVRIAPMVWTALGVGPGNFNASSR
jgi:hypothetical protein